MDMPSTLVEHKYKRGDKVQKIKGYKFPGVVLERILKLDGVTELYLVECTAAGAEGMCHIFRGADLEPYQDPNRCKLCGMVRNAVCWNSRDAEEAAIHGDSICYNWLASNGGGEKGMRYVDSNREFLLSRLGES